MTIKPTPPQFFGGFKDYHWRPCRCRLLKRMSQDRVFYYRHSIRLFGFRLKKQPITTNLDEQFLRRRIRDQWAYIKELQFNYLSSPMEHTRFSEVQASAHEVLKYLTAKLEEVCQTKSN